MDSLFDEEDAAGTPATLTVAELSDRVARLTASAFPTDLWVSGQIRNLKRSANGHVYFDLAEPPPPGAPPRLQIPITLLEPERRHVNAQLKRAGGAVRMEDGIEVRITGRLRWYPPRGQIQFRMHGVDPEFTIGRLQQDRERLLRMLAAEGLLEANGALPMPVVPLRIGLVTSSGSAAEADVRHELESAGIAFDVVFADARTQGANCGPSVVRALASLAHERVDVILLVRGGGARTDLVGFDGEDIARAIAASPVPVLTGIGHEVDRSVADDIAHTAHKTPTAAAASLVERVRSFLQALDSTWTRALRAATAASSVAEGRLDRRAARLARATGRVLDRHEAALAAGTDRLGRSATRALDRADSRLSTCVGEVGGRARRALDGASARIDLCDARRASHDPAIALARGWSITTGPDGRVVRDPALLEPGAELTTRVSGGRIRSTVASVHPDPPTAPGPDGPKETPDHDR